MRSRTNNQILMSLFENTQKILTENDKKFLQSICYGMCREWFHLEEIESQLLDKPLKARDQILSSIVRCGIYELGWMRSKEHAVVSEYVDVTVTEERPLGSRPRKRCASAVYPEKIRTKNGATLRTNAMEPSTMVNRHHKNQLARALGTSISGK